MSWLTPELIDVIIAVLKAIVILLVVVVCGALLSFVERRLLGWWQDRYGPNRVGPFGMFQIAADMLKMFFKEDWTPPFADKTMKRIAIIAACAGTAIALGWLLWPSLVVGSLAFVEKKGEESSRAVCDRIVAVGPRVIPAAIASLKRNIRRLRPRLDSC